MLILFLIVKNTVSLFTVSFPYFASQSSGHPIGVAGEPINVKVTILYIYFNMEIPVES